MGLNLGQAVPGWTASTAAGVDVVDWEGCWYDPIKTLEMVKDGDRACYEQKW